MRSLRIISDKIHDNIIYNLADIGNTPINYPLSYLNTGYLIQIIASLDKEKIFEWQHKSKDKYPDLHRRIKSTAKLIMDGCMRSIDLTIATHHIITVWLDASLHMLRHCSHDASIQGEQILFWEKTVSKLFEIVNKFSDIKNMSTVDLSRFAKSMSLMQKTGINASDGDILIESSLELLYRRNKFGFFCFDAYDQSTLPLSKQFFVLDCLLECSQSTGLDIILNEVLKVFNDLCSMAKKNPTGHFTFRSGETIVYSAESIGNISMGLSAVLLLLEETNQRKSIMRTLEELYLKLLSSRLAGGKSATNNTENSPLLLKGDMATHIAELLTSWLSDRIILNFSEQSVKHMSHRHNNDWQILYLCRCLLDVTKRVKLLPKLY